LLLILPQHLTHEFSSLLAAALFTLPYQLLCSRHMILAVKLPVFFLRLFKKEIVGKGKN
jgi:hypothetical protein